MPVAEPTDRLWLAVRGIYDSWPRVDEGTIFGAGQAWTQASQRMTGVSGQARAAGTAATRAWPDASGTTMTAQVAGFTGQLDGISKQAGQVANLADRYGTAVVGTKDAIVSTIQDNAARYASLATPRVPAVGEVLQSAMAHVIAYQLKGVVDKQAGALRASTAQGLPGASGRSGPAGLGSDVAQAAGDVGDAVANAGAAAVNGLASLGNAVLDHPLDALGLAGGAALAGVGAAGDVAGGLLDAVPGGAVLGVPLNVAATGAVATGAGLAAASATDLARHAMGDDRVQPMQVNSWSRRSSERAQRSLQKQIDEHEDKLEKYQNDPDAHDNKGFLKNAPSDEVRQRIIQGRSRHLRKEIDTFKKQLDEEKKKGGG